MDDAMMFPVETRVEHLRRIEGPGEDYAPVGEVKLDCFGYVWLRHEDGRWLAGLREEQFTALPDGALLEDRFGGCWRKDQKYGQGWLVHTLSGIRLSFDLAECYQWAVICVPEPLPEVQAAVLADELDAMHGEVGELRCRDEDDYLGGGSLSREVPLD